MINLLEYKKDAAMIRFAICFLHIFMCLACGGSLSDEQRKGLQKEKRQREIKRIKAEDIYNKAAEIGQMAIAAATINGPKKAERQCACKIRKVTRGSEEMTSKEKELWLAYLSAEVSELPANNVQKDGDDFFIVSSPIVKDSTGHKSIQGVWFVRLSKKQIVLVL